MHQLLLRAQDLRFLALGDGSEEIFLAVVTHRESASDVKIRGILGKDSIEDSNGLVVVAGAVEEHRLVVLVLITHKNAFDNAGYDRIVLTAQVMALPIQLISTDFDGTLHAEFENPPVPVRLERNLAALQKQGAKWIINTGRDLSSLLETLARARLSIWPDYLGLVEREIYVREGHEYHPLAGWNSSCNTAHTALFAQMRPDVRRLTDWIEARFQATIYEDPFSPLCMIASSNAEADQILVYLEDYCSGVANLTVVRNDIYARFSHSSYNKGTVVGEVARRLGIAREAIFAAGDHLNDIPMLDGVYAGMVAAPQNAIPAVKALIEKVGGYQSDQPWGHGIASALEHFSAKTNHSPGSRVSKRPGPS